LALAVPQQLQCVVDIGLRRGPRILVPDDSTSSVDLETEFLIQQALSAVMRGRATSVVVSCLRTPKSATHSRVPSS